MRGALEATAAEAAEPAVVRPAEPEARAEVREPARAPAEVEVRAAARVGRGRKRGRRRRWRRQAAARERAQAEARARVEVEVQAEALAPAEARAQAEARVQEGARVRPGAGQGGSAAGGSAGSGGSGGGGNAGQDGGGRGGSGGSAGTAGTSSDGGTTDAGGGDGRSQGNVVLIDVNIDTMPAGQIRWELRPDAAPKTAARIKALVEMGFYNGVIFHRVVPNFVIQGGDPTGTGSGGSGQTDRVGRLAAEERSWFGGHGPLGGQSKFRRLSILHQPQRQSEPRRQWYREKVRGVCGRHRRNGRRGQDRASADHE